MKKYKLIYVSFPPGLDFLFHTNYVYILNHKSSYTKLGLVVGDLS